MRITFRLTIIGLFFLAASPAFAEAQVRRVLYNFDGDSCTFTKANGKGPVPTTVDDLKTLIAEVTGKGSRVDTILICINAQVMYYPTKVGTMRGADSTAEERAQWPASEKQRSANIRAFFDAGNDPYAIMLAEAKKKGREALLSFRVNDAHGNDFLRTRFWTDHPECRLPRGALDFGRAEVRDYVFKLIEESVTRYDCDGIELDFNRFPTLFREQEETTEERVAKIDGLVERVRGMLDRVGRERGRRRLVLAVRIPSNYGRKTPSPETSRAIGCDPAAWARKGWIDFVTVSDFLFTRYDLPIRPWKDLIREIPVYGGIECAEGGRRDQALTAEKYRTEAVRLRKDGADGIYLFNFFTTREHGADSWEPPFEVLTDLGEDRLATTTR
jgi:hypothetical protein